MTCIRFEPESFCPQCIRMEKRLITIINYMTANGKWNLFAHSMLL